ncbi:MAG: hypothetical protein WC501_03945 [Candidatus Micrarchaeia archaeon]
MKLSYLFLILIIPVVFFGCLDQLQKTEDSIVSTPEINDPNENDIIENNNPVCNCNEDEDCINNICVLKKGCNFNNPPCTENEKCTNNSCVLKEECNFNADCPANYICKDNSCIKYCTKDSNCLSDEICKNGECLKVECKINSNCKSSTKYCVNYECKTTRKCLYDLNCDYDQVCIDLQCHNIVDCTKGICEDDYFKFEYVAYEDRKNERAFSATIHPKTDLKGAFRILWNEPGSYGYFKSVEKSFETDDKYLQFLIIQSSPFQQTEHYLIEHTGDPELLYLIWQSKIDLEED